MMEYDLFKYMSILIPLISCYSPPVQKKQVILYFERIGKYQ